MRHRLKITAACFLLAAGFLLQGQILVPKGLPPGFRQALLDVLGGGPAFYGRATIQILNDPDKEPTFIPFKIAVLSGKLRLETGLFDGITNLPPSTAAQLKKMRAISILRPDRNRLYMVLPDTRSLVEIAYSKSTGTDPSPPPQINKTSLGKELVNDQLCDKTQWKVTESNGEEFDLTVWMPADSGGVPARIKFNSPPALVTFQDLRLVPPDSSQFEPPGDYIKYEGIQENILREIEQARKTNTYAP
jgi:hypothetical protein